MEGLSASCPVLGRLSGNLADLQGADPASQTSSGTSLSCGYPFGNPYYGCRLPYSHSVDAQQNPRSFHPGEKRMEALGVLPSEELSSRSRDFPVYSSFAGSYKTVPGYLEVPGIRHGALFPADSRQHWALTGWDEQLHYSKEQTHFNHPWNSSQFSDVLHQPEMNGYRLGRKKRVPYTKFQLKELEREYEDSRFISRDRRRRISASTDLSERQVTIWFQNRRVKDRKFVCRSSSSKALHVL